MHKIVNFMLTTARLQSTRRRIGLFGGRVVSEDVPKEIHSILALGLVASQNQWSRLTLFTVYVLDSELPRVVS